MDYSPNTMKFLIADDHGIFRRGLKMILMDLYPDATILEADCAKNSLQLAAEHPDLDLILIDLQLPDSPGLELLAQIQQRFITLPCAVISADERADTVRKSLDAGALGYIPKSAKNAVITSAIQLILSGGMYAPHELLSNIPTSAEPAPASMGPTNLTSRQLEVLQLMAEGLANKQIGDRLNIAPGTTKAHISAIFRELNVTNRTQAVASAQKLNLI